MPKANKPNALFSEHVYKIFHMRFITNQVIIVLVVCFFCNCKKEVIENPAMVDQMVLVYMAANNDLRGDAINCINHMEAGYTGTGNLLVYIKTASENSYILKIRHDDTERIVSDTIATYASENSSDPQFLSRVVEDARRLGPAAAYGLVLWSHASSWAPPLGVRVKSFGEDRGVDMDIMDLKQALPADFSYIIFDACSMASIEAIYELRGNAKYILASPTEVLSTSYPYREIVPYLFGGESELKVVGQKFMDYYQSLSGDYASATVSLIATGELELFAQRTKALFDAKIPPQDFNIEAIQRLDFDPTSRVPAYDFLDFLDHNYETEDYALIAEQLEKVVLFKANTSNFLNSPIRKFSGISIYLPRAYEDFQDYYSQLAWYRDGGSYHLFNAIGQ